MSVEIIAVPGIPEVREGDDLGAVVTGALGAAGLALLPGDILVIASKVVSKAGGLRRYASRDSVIVDETVRVVAERRAGERVTRIVESVAGPVMAAAGVDESNVGDAGGVLVLPRDADAAAARVLAEVRAALSEREAAPQPTVVAERVEGRPPGRPGAATSTQPTRWSEVPLGVVVSDTAGRPWRAGVVDFALGSAGVRVVEDHRGGVDADGRPLSVTVIAVADEIAAAADLVKAKSGALPVAIVRGLPWASAEPDDPGASSLVRSGPGDWFRLGPVEAVREALGVEAGSAASVAVGLRSVGSDPVEERLGRVLRLALHGLGPEVTGTVTQAGITLSASDAYGLGRVVERAGVAAASEELTLVERRLSPTSVALTLGLPPDRAAADSAATH